MAVENIGTSSEAQRAARIQLLLDCTKALRSVDSLKNKLDAISKVNIMASSEKGLGIAEKINEESKNAKQAFKSFQNEVSKAKAELEKSIAASNGQTIKGKVLDISTAKANYEDAINNLNEFKKLCDSLNYQKLQQRREQLNAKEIAQAKKFHQSILQQKRQQIKEEQRLEAERQKALKAAEKSQTVGSTKKETDFNYQKALAATERQAASLYHELQNCNDATRRIELSKKLLEATEQYKKLNRESVKFRKSFGVQSSRGFYDLNHNLDYFMAKFRSRLTYMFAGIAQRGLDSMTYGLINQISQYEQNYVNFAQVMPDHIANNQETMNNAMKGFIDVASDYGASVEEVTEAGRLWGRQYKDVAMVQALVANSTKLSITDNMKLVEVNKALEATMQQYNIRLQDANEAQAVSGKIVDSWAKLADTAVVTAADLAAANERSAGAAYQAGIGFDFLQGMIATMSTATGRAGGEIGRSIRSMLVSMNTDKGRKELEKIGVAVYELDTKGQKHVRNFENIILDLMQKLKTSEKDVSKTILAMSGGKFQYNNVMALLKNYDELLKNIKNSQDSEGWADQQVGLQAETISRQIKGLTADVENLIRELHNSGLNEYIVGTIKYLREFIIALQYLDPKKLQVLGDMILLFLGIKSGLMALRIASTFAVSSFQAISIAGTSLSAILASVRTGTLSTAAAFRTLSLATGYIGIVVTALSALYTLYDALAAKQNDAVANAQREAEATKKKNSEIDENINNLKRQASEIENVRKSQADSTKTAEEVNALKEKEKIMLENLTLSLGEEAKAKLDATGDIQQAINIEIEAQKKLQKSLKALAVVQAQTELDRTKALADGIRNRIKLYESELEIMKAMGVATNNVLDNAGKNGNIFDSFVSKRTGDMREEINGALPSQEQIDSQANKIAKEKKALIDANNAMLEAEKKLKKAKAEVHNVDIGGSPQGYSDDDSSGSKNGGSGSKNYAEQSERLRYQREKNALYYDAKTAAKNYETALKELEQAEKNEGITAKNSIAKVKLFDDRKKELESYQAQLEQFQRELVLELDSRMANDSKLSEMIGYRVDMTDKEKFKALEVNRETFQQLKTYTEIVNSINELNTKIAETKGKIVDVNNEIQNTKRSTNPDKMLQEKLDEIQHQTEMFKFSKDGYNDPYADQESYVFLLKQLQQRRDAITAHLAYVQNQIIEFKGRNDLEDAQAMERTARKLLEQQASIDVQIRQMRLDSTKTIREGLFDVTNQLLVEGNSWKDIWKSLWKNLAKEALAALFKVQVQVGLLGALMRMFGLGGNVGNFTTVNGVRGQQFGDNFVSNSPVPKTKHTGGSISSAFPRMHSGGEVVAGRVGVVPTLKNDEVLRTLQVGEEVNSINDRRSNEILAAVAMKAMDSQAKQPTNVQIMALDAKSFAEYLNENSDILMAVLAKNNAMGRRA
nr:MAG TPA_asm: minor tail protein [Caudoviricetes sp.]